jgi:hypothetical protein
MRRLLLRALATLALTALAVGPAPAGDEFNYTYPIGSENGPEGGAGEDTAGQPDQAGALPYTGPASTLGPLATALALLSAASVYVGRHRARPARQQHQMEHRGRGPAVLPEQPRPARLLLCQAVAVLAVWARVWAARSRW